MPSTDGYFGSTQAIARNCKAFVAKAFERGRERVKLLLVFVVEVMQRVCGKQECIFIAVCNGCTKGVYDCGEDGVQDVDYCHSGELLL